LIRRRETPSVCLFSMQRKNTPPGDESVYLVCVERILTQQKLYLLNIDIIGKLSLYESSATLSRSLAVTIALADTVQSPLKGGGAGF